MAAEWISKAHLKNKWKINNDELLGYIEKGLDVYDVQKNLIDTDQHNEFNRSVFFARFKVDVLKKRKFLRTIEWFKVDDVIEFENENGIIPVEVEQETEIDEEEDGRARAPVKSGNLFTKNSGDYWHIGLKGKDAKIKQIDGLLYISYLLEKPGISISCIQLSQAVSGKTPDKITTKGAAIDEGLNIGSSTQTVNDPKSKRDYAKRYRTLQNDLENAESEMERREIQGEMEGIMSHLKQNSFPSNVKKNQSNVKRRMKTAYKAIDKAGMEDLTNHLRAFIKPDNAYGFSYIGSLGWNITL